LASNETMFMRDFVKPDRLVRTSKQSHAHTHRNEEYGDLPHLASKKDFFIFLWLYSPIQALAASMKLNVSLQLLNLGQSVELLGRVISSSQGLYLYTNTE
jgi:hypothetical protein